MKLKLKIEVDATDVNKNGKMDWEEFKLFVYKVGSEVSYGPVIIENMQNIFKFCKFHCNLLYLFSKIY